jgi:cell wall-associated NlpC family hydrolase
MQPDLSKYVGIPFVDHGRNLAGCDCWGLIRLIYKNEFGIDLPDMGPLYNHVSDMSGMANIYVDQLPKWEKTQAPKTGDVVLLRIQSVPIHVGIVLDGSTMLHVMQGCDAVVENFNTPLWKNRVEGFYRWKKS